jgi:HEPN domain-containing protein
MPKMSVFSTKDGYRVDDMLQFGLAHVSAACVLFNKSASYYDSAGYLAQLGVELILKAWHLHSFGEFHDKHNLIALYDELIAKDASIKIGAKHVRFLKELDTFYLLRYPRRNEGAIEIGSDHLQPVEALVEAVLAMYAETAKQIIKRIDPTKKGGRVLMKRKISASPARPRTSPPASNSG